MKQNIWMPLYVGDYLRDTMHLNTVQHGAYLLLMLHAWCNNGSVPNDPVQLQAIARLSPDEWKANASVLLSFWLPDATGQQLTQKRLAAELARAKAVSDVRRAAGSIGGRARVANAQANAQANAKQNSRQSQSQSQSQVTLGALSAPASDEEWLDHLQADEAYKALDVKAEYSKMVNWCGVNGKKPSRRRFINWLNRAEKPMGAPVAPATLPPWLQVKTLEERIIRHPANRESVLYDANCTEEQKTELKSLRAKLAELKGL